MKRATLAFLLLLTAACRNDVPEKKDQHQATIIKSEHETETADGVTIALRRYRLSTGSTWCEPVFMSAGFLESGNVFDLYPNHSLAEYLAWQGFDVWTYDIRGTGDSESPDVGDLFGWTFSIDHFIYLDTPAALQYVLDTTGCEQVMWVSHSSGSLMMYGYLETNCSSKVKAAVSICGIGVLDSSQDLPGQFADFFFGVGLFLAPYLPSNMPVPLKWALDQILGDDAEKWALLSYLFTTPAGSLMWNNKNMNANLVYQMLTKVLPNTSTNVFKQFFNWADKGDCCSDGVTYTPTPGGPNPYAGAPDPPIEANSNGTVTIARDFSITQNLDRIQCPMLILSGEEDRIVPPQNAVHVFDNISSIDKSYQNCSVADGASVDFGHTDTIIGKNAKSEVYPNVSNWLKARASK